MIMNFLSMFFKDIIISKSKNIHNDKKRKKMLDISLYLCYPVNTKLRKKVTSCLGFI